jgi:hypothetical protein
LSRWGTTIEWCVRGGGFWVKKPENDWWGSVFANNVRGLAVPGPLVMKGGGVLWIRWW